MNTIANRISGLLEEKNLTQRKLAELVGVSEVTISRYLKGTRNPKSDIIKDISSVLGVSTDYLLGSAESKDKSSQLSTTTKKTDSAILDVSDLNEKSIKAVEDYINLLRIKEMQERNSKNSNSNYLIGN